MEEADRRFGHAIEVIPGMAARRRREINGMGNAEGVQFFMEPVIAAKPRMVFRIDGEKEMRWVIVRGHMHESGILAGLLFAVEHGVERETLAVDFVKIKRGSNAGRHGE